jgi:hypothetical protein
VGVSGQSPAVGSIASAGAPTRSIRAGVPMSRSSRCEHQLACRCWDRFQCFAPTGLRNGREGGGVSTFRGVAAQGGLRFYVFAGWLRRGGLRFYVFAGWLRRAGLRFYVSCKLRRPVTRSFRNVNPRKGLRLNVFSVYSRRLSLWLCLRPAWRKRQARAGSITASSAARPQADRRWETPRAAASSRAASLGT